MISTTISSLKSKVITGDSLKSIYVISDVPKLDRIITKHQTNSQTIKSRLLHFELRTIRRKGKDYIVSSDNPLLLSYIKDSKDDFHVTPIDNYLLKSYSLQSKHKVVHISECHCNIEDKKEVCFVKIVSW